MILVSKADFFMKNKQKQAVNSRKVKAFEVFWNFMIDF